VDFEAARQIRIELLSNKGATSSPDEYTGELWLICLRMGSCRIDVGSQSEMLDSTVVAVIPPNEFYKLTARDEAIDGVRIAVPAALELLFEQRGFTRGVQFLHSSTNFVCLRADEASQRRIIRLLGLLEGYTGDDEVVAYGRLASMELFILELVQMAAEDLSGSSPDKTNPASRSQLIKSVVAYINEHYMDNIHLDNISKRFWVSPSYLSRHFREKVGIGITHFIIEHRIYIAKKLLLTTDMRVREIANEVGFNSATYFNTVFKRGTGVSPREYRSEMKM